MPDSHDALKIPCVSPDGKKEQTYSLQPGDSVYLGKDPQQPGAGITLTGATNRVSSTAAMITFQGGTVLVEHLSSASSGVVTEAFVWIPAEGGPVRLPAGQQMKFDKPGHLEIPDAGGPHVVHLGLDV